MRQVNIALDESGNFGKEGDYIVVGGIQYTNSKPIKNFMKKQELKFREMYPVFENKEIKHTNAYPAMRHHYINNIVKKSEFIHYCVSNKRKVDNGMLNDENILYNYMVYRIVYRVIYKNPDLKELNLLLDNRTTKITRRRSLNDYIKAKVYFDIERPDITINIDMLDSVNSRVIQAADFIAGSIYQYYTHNNELCYNIFREKLDCAYRYPYNDFK